MKSRTGLPVCPWGALSPVGRSRGGQNPAASGAACGWVLTCCMYVCVRLGCVRVPASVCVCVCVCAHLSLTDFSPSLLALSVSLCYYLFPSVGACLLGHRCPYPRRVASRPSAFLVVSLTPCLCLGRVARWQSFSPPFQYGFVKAWAMCACASEPQGRSSPPHPVQPVC